MEKKHFTIVELMIVVAVIGLLAAIALPSFIRARENSQRNVCINNMRQLHGGAVQAVFNGISIDNVTGAGPDQWWDDGVGFYLDGDMPPRCPARLAEDYEISIVELEISVECDFHGINHKGVSTSD